LPTFSGTGNIASTTALTVTAITTGAIGPGVLVATTSGIPANAYITEQLYGATGTSAANTTLNGAASVQGSSASSLPQTIVVTSATGIAIGHLIAGNGAQVAGIRADTYVTNIVGTTITLSNSLTATIATGTGVYFYVPSGLGAYTMSAAATATTTGVALTSSGQYFAGGGGGATNLTGAPIAGGAGGGGSGGNLATSPRLNAQSGAPNTGGGGGGSRDTVGAAGGSGIVVIRYTDSSPLAAATTGSPTVTTAGGYRVYKYTSSGTITF
jgi:hypothetical protein